LRLATIFDATQMANWQPVPDSFTAANPDITIAVESTAGSGAAVFPDVQRTSMASGDPADVFFMWDGALLMAWMPPPDGIAMCQCDDC
jgi:raffinose/stachyose/melibiose transport system substrate-binding protein